MSETHTRDFAEVIRRKLENEPDLDQTVIGIGGEWYPLAQPPTLAAPPVAADVNTEDQIMLRTLRCPGCKKTIEYPVGETVFMVLGSDGNQWHQNCHDVVHPKIKPVVAADIAEGREVLAKSWRKELNTIAAMVGRPGLSPDEQSDGHIAESVRSRVEQLAAFEEALEQRQPGWEREFAASEEHHQEHHKREEELLDELARLRAENGPTYGDLLWSLKEAEAERDALKAELARLRAAVPGEVREAAERLMNETRVCPMIDDFERKFCSDIVAVCRYIASIAEPAAGKQLADIHYNPSTIHDGPP